MTILGTGGPVAAFATAYGGNNDGDLIDTDRIIEKTRTDVDRITQDLLNEAQDLVEGVITGLPITTTPPPTSSSPPPQCFGQYSTIVGTSGDDTIDGIDGPDVISGLEEMMQYSDTVETTVSVVMKVMMRYLGMWVMSIYLAAQAMTGSMATTMLSSPPVVVNI